MPSPTAEPQAPSRGRTLGLRGLLGGLALAGCASVGPNFHPPAPPLADGYAAKGDRRADFPRLSSDARVAGPWWKALGYPDLDAVMDRALAHNPTIEIAQATLEKARDQAAKAKAELGPSANASAGYTRQRINLGAVGFPGFPNPTFGLYSIGPTVSYDLDLFGGGRRRLEAARAAADVQASKADAAYLTLTANVAIQAVKIAGLRAQIEAVQTLIADDRKSIDILQAAQDAGGDSPSAGLGGHRRLEEDQALLPPLEQQLAQARHALSQLVGEPPSVWSPPDFEFARFRIPGEIPLVVPSALVRRRPDIAAAEAQLHADTAVIGFQTARLYPDVRLSAGYTQEALNPDKLFGFGAAAYAFGPQASLPLYDGGAIRADRRAAQAQARASFAQYRQSVVTAFVQVSDVLSALGQDQERLARLTAAEATARASLEDAREAYRLGGGPLSDVVRADREWRQASLERIVAAGQQLADVVELYGATAADWRAGGSEAAASNSALPSKAKGLAPQALSP